MTKKPSNSRALWKYLAALPLCFLLVFAFANREGKTKFLPFNSVSSNFNPIKIKAELHELIPIREIVFGEKERRAAFEKLFNRFDELMMEYPTYRNELKLIAEEVTNGKGIEVAFVREENSEDLYSIVSLETWRHSLIYNDPICKDADEMPRFPGCEEKAIEERKECAQNKMLQFIFSNIKYPEEAQKKGVEGTVVSKFIIGVDGKIRDAEIVRKIGSGCDEAVLEIIAQMPDWIPGKKDGKNVAVEFHLPVKFKLASDAPEKEPAIPAPLAGKASLELKNFSISPNPNNGEFRVHFEGEKMPLSLVVFNMKGETLFTKNIANFSGSFDEMISVKTSSETLFIAVSNTKEETVYWEKIIVKK